MHYTKLFFLLSSVKYLDLTSNFIQGFPEMLVTGLPHLKELLFRRNSLQKLGHRSFRGLFKLEVGAKLVAAFMTKQD